MSTFWVFVNFLKEYNRYNVQIFSVNITFDNVSNDISFGFVAQNFIISTCLRMSTECIYFSEIVFSLKTKYDDITEYVYLFYFLSSNSASYSLVDIALMKLRHCRCVWGSQLNTYPQSVLYLTCCRRIITNCTVLKKDDPCCGNSQWNGLPMGFEFTIGMSLHMPMGFVLF